ncbi:hypothetical protein [Gemmata massiliana]|uniref:hypothetical protein n=1 Tax=Gemmata massiliana TaxID=1210884 RepID=UPI0018D6EC87|nr:hypothetical protein [Gemmata massiliana]
MLREIVRSEVVAQPWPQLGVVEAVYPHRETSDADNYACDVRLKSHQLLLPRVPIVTGHIGTAAIPNVGELVLVIFVDGDQDHPLIIGRYYNDVQRPPPNRENEVIFRLPLAEADSKTVKAAVRRVDGPSLKRELIIELLPRITVQLVDNGILLSTGKTTIHCEQPDDSSGTVTISAGRSNIVIKQDGDINMSAAGAISIRATGDLTLEGQSVKVQSRTDVGIEGQTQAALKGGLSATVDGGMAANVQATAVTIKGQTAFVV